jgi:ATP-binding protein involved in chromosome partitioning
MTSYSEAAVLRALGAVRDPLSDRDVVSAGRLSDLNFEAGRLRVILGLPPETTQDQGLALRDAAEAALGQLSGVNQVAVLLTTHKAAPSLKSSSPKRADKNPHPNKRPDGYQGDAKVARTIAISSAKGGVGKSTVTVGLARALAAQCNRVGILDADIHGPSVPTLLGLQEQLGTREVEGRRLIVPAETDGLKAISIGLLTGNDDPVVWRGPMVQGAIARMLWDTDWGELDLLLIDMPPGTGDARKGVSMFEKVDIPVIGWIENMSVFTCPDCGSEHHIFGDGQLDLTVPKLGSLPLSIEMRAARAGYENLGKALLGLIT